MFDEVIVPLDGSSESARALRPASAVAHYLDVNMRVVAYHPPKDDAFELTRLVRKQVGEIGDVSRSIEIGPMNEPVAQLVQRLREESPDALVAMSTRGRSRSAALIGSVANEVLSRSHLPVLLIGPECDVARFRLHGPMIVATDASPCTESALKLAADVTEAFDFEPIVVNVIDPATARALDRARSGPSGYDYVPDSAMAHRFSEDLGELTGITDVDYQVLHGNNPGRSIAAHVDDVGARLVTMATHARSGLGRLALGSVTAHVVAHSHCPVLVIAPELPNGDATPAEPSDAGELVEEIE